MKAYELGLGDIFRQTSAPENLWRVSDLGTVKRGGSKWEGITAKMGKTHIQLIEGPIGDGRITEYDRSMGRTIKDILWAAINPNTNVELVERGKEMTPMRFGAHKGKQIESVPQSYLTWAYENCWHRLDRQQLAYILKKIINA